MKGNQKGLPGIYLIRRFKVQVILGSLINKSISRKPCSEPPPSPCRPECVYVEVWMSERQEDRWIEKGVRDSKAEQLLLS